MWGLMAQGCAGNGADVVEGLVTPRPWAVEVVTVTTTAPITGTTTSAGNSAGRVAQDTAERGEGLTHSERTRAAQPTGKERLNRIG